MIESYAFREIEKRFANLKKAASPGGDKSKLTEALLALAEKTVEELHACERTEIEKLAVNKYRLPVMTSIFSNGPEEISCYAEEIGLGREFPMKKVKCNDSLRLWVAGKIALIVEIQSRRSCLDNPALSDEQEHLHEWILELEPPAINVAREYARLLRFWFLIEFQGSMTMGDSDEGNEYLNPLIDGRAKNRATSIAKKDWDKRMDRAKQSLAEELSQLGGDHIATAYDLEEKIKEECQKKASVTRENLENALLETLSRELKAVLR